MSQINRPPLGLQELLGSQNFGDNPKDLGNLVSPTLDMLPFYGAGALKYRSTSGGRNGEGLISNVTLFGTVALIGCSAWAETGLTVGSVGKLGLTMNGIATQTVPGDVEMVLAANEDGVAWPATSQPALAFTFPSPLVVEQGCTINSRWFYWTGNADTIRLVVAYYDLSGGANG